MHRFCISEHDDGKHELFLFEEIIYEFYDVGNSSLFAYSNSGKTSVPSLFDVHLSQALRLRALNTRNILPDK